VGGDRERRGGGGDREEKGRGGRGDREREIADLLLFLFKKEEERGRENKQTYLCVF